MKTRKRALTRANKTIQNLESEISTLKRNISTRNKQIEHLRKKGSHKEHNFKYTTKTKRKMYLN